jgi:hypothetical protein
MEAEPYSRGILVTVLAASSWMGSTMLRARCYTGVRGSGSVRTSPLGSLPALVLQNPWCLVGGDTGDEPRGNPMIELRIGAWRLPEIRQQYNVGIVIVVIRGSNKLQPDVFKGQEAGWA